MILVAVRHDMGMLIKRCTQMKRKDKEVWVEPKMCVMSDSCMNPTAKKKG